MITAFPVRFDLPGDDGARVREQARLEIALVTPAGSSKNKPAALITLTIWSDSGRYDLAITAPMALAAAGELSTILEALFPANVSSEPAQIEG